MDVASVITVEGRIDDGRVGKMGDEFLKESPAGL